ncbi:hypothetical protein DVJ83_16405 (plasmid) [Deinococcus wulumuqiensis]|uniref:DNA methylase adenine-specific domain-containing protein n=1 Tax=Deinococcus wulumuqiensis TaxID=980427 RepID=A0A345IM05_9DEIO|nr:N-6 DNA methylase [Deinococcus wulumuqiensis]AXH00728.1 hypothetical protein DVJ83_16405 [Deinococcus wulumuqiensis]
MKRRVPTLAHPLLAPAAPAGPDVPDLRRVVARLNSALRNTVGGSITERLDGVIQLLIARMYDEFEVRTAQKPALELTLNCADDGDVIARVHHLYERAATSPVFQRAFPPGRRQFTVANEAIPLCISTLQTVRLSDSLQDVKGAAFQEVLRDTFDKNDNQQFFTPLEISDLMTGIALSLVDRPLSQVRVCDPAVGTGGLLLGIVRAALSTFGQKTARARERAIQAYLEQHVYGVDIDERMAWIAGVNVALLAGSAANIVHLNGGGGSLTLDREDDPLQPGTFGLIVTNPPFGAEVVHPQILDAYELGRQRPSRRRSILFVERCLNLLEPGGFAILVVDDSVLNQPSTTDVRAFIRREAVVRAVFSLPDTAFMPYATVKASVLVLQKRGRNVQDGPIFMTDIEHTGRKPNGEVLYTSERNALGQREIRSDLPLALHLFHTFLATGQVPSHTALTAFHVTEHELNVAAREDGLANVASGTAGRLDVVRYHPMAQDARQTLHDSPYPVVPLGTLVNVRSERVNPHETPEDFFQYVGLADIEKFTGEWVANEVQGDTIKSTCNAYHGGDVIFARMRPNLRKVVRVPDTDAGGICSSECLVLKLKPNAENQIDPEYLAWFLRSDLVFGQVMAQVTGVGRPRVSTSSLLAVQIPLLPLAQQRQQVMACQRSQEQMIKARQEAQNQLAETERGYLAVLQHVGHPPQGALDA